jgi:alpha-D-ribose 1-methylphosphonate 5-triphosphate diphosphatase
VPTLIYNATLVLPDSLIEHGWLLIEDGKILDLGDETTLPDDKANVLDGMGGYVMPGFIDLHSDAIEKIVEPRPNVFFDIHTAIHEADFRLACSGITSEYHAVSLNDSEFGVRSNGFIRDLYRALSESREEHLIRHKVHARLELTSKDGFGIVEQMIAHGECDMISLMDHSPGQGQYPTVESFRNYIVSTTGRSVAEVDEMLEQKRLQLVHIPERIEHVTRQARAAGLAIATHDDDTASKVEQWPQLGVNMSEFPTTMEAARRASELGLAVCMGAPNVVRGRSTGGNLSALDAIRAGVADVLCADYYPTAMLHAVFALVRQQVLTLPAAVRMVTLNAARAVLIEQEFGSLEPGKVADVILVHCTKQGLPRVQSVFVGGEQKLHVSQQSLPLHSLQTAQ